MRWIKSGHEYDTNTSRLVFVFPTKPAKGYGVTDDYRGYDTPGYQPRALGIRAKKALRDPKIWATLDGRYFLTANERSFSLNEDMTDVNYYYEWDDPHRSVEEINDCCHPLKNFERVKRIVEPHVTAQAYEKLFGKVPSPAELGAQAQLVLDGLAEQPRIQEERQHLMH